VRTSSQPSTNQELRMPARRRAVDPPPLSDDDVAAITSELRRGKAPRVTVRSTAGQPGGSRGPVVEVRDPALGGAEYIVVRVGGDDLPFAPHELSLGRRATAGRAAPALPAKATRSTKASPTTRSRKTPARKAAASPRTPSRAGEAKAASPATRTRKEAPAKDTQPARSAGPRRRRAGSPISVTVHYDGETWTAEATKGGRSLARRQRVRPAQAEAVARALGIAAVVEAVGAIVATQRADVEAKAASLRGALAELEAELADYAPRPPRAADR
jgi:hypothetical protein